MAEIHSIAEHSGYHRRLRLFYGLYPVHHNAETINASYWVPNYRKLEHGREYSVFELMEDYGMANIGQPGARRYQFFIDRIA